MNFKSHLFGGLGAAGLLFVLCVVGVNMGVWGIDALVVVVGVIVCVIYSLLPDLDHPNSKIRKYVEILALIIVIVGLLGVYTTELAHIITPHHGALAGLVSAVFLLGLWSCKHRGIMHSLWFGVLISIPLVLLHPMISVFALSGFITHLILDK